MKLVYTTLACPKWDIDTIIAKTKAYGFDAVDFRGYLGDNDIPKLAGFSAKLKDTARKFADGGVPVIGFSSSACLTNGSAALEEVRAYLPVCRAFGSRFLRIYGGSLTGLSRPEAIKVAARCCRPAADMAADSGVTLLIETHDEWVDTPLLRSLMEAIDSPAAGVLWDVHHPYRFAGELPRKTWVALGQWIKNTHWKDSQSGKGPHDYTLCLMGKGDLPLRDICRQLVNGGYDGPYTLEWEKRWVPQLDEPEVALPQYVEFMKKLAAGL